MHLAFAMFTESKIERRVSYLRIVYLERRKGYSIVTTASRQI